LLPACRRKDETISACIGRLKLLLQKTESIIPIADRIGRLNTTLIDAIKNNSSPKAREAIKETITTAWNAGLLTYPEELLEKAELIETAANYRHNPEVITVDFNATEAMTQQSKPNNRERSRNTNTKVTINTDKNRSTQFNRSDTPNTVQRSRSHGDTEAEHYKGQHRSTDRQQPQQTTIPFYPQQQVLTIPMNPYQFYPPQQINPYPYYQSNYPRYQSRSPGRSRDYQQNTQYRPNSRDNQQYRDSNYNAGYNQRSQSREQQYRDNQSYQNRQRSQYDNQRNRSPYNRSVNINDNQATVQNRSESPYNDNRRQQNRPNSPYPRNSSQTRQQRDYNNGNRSRSRSPGPCYNCNKPGHISKDCPDKENGQNSNNNNSQQNL
jgi:hypothetical protein